MMSIASSVRKSTPGGQKTKAIQQILKFDKASVGNHCYTSDIGLVGNTGFKKKLNKEWVLDLLETLARHHITTAIDID